MKEYTIRPNGTLRIQTINEEPSLAQQQFKEECDVNHIMKKYEQTGQIYHVNRKQGVYADLSNLTDYRQMLADVQKAEEAFQSLPAKVRYEFGNDPSKLIHFLQDKNNKSKAIELGLIEKTNDDSTTTITPDVPPKI